MEPLEFDARPFQREGKEPFPYIMKAVEKLTPGQDFVLTNTFDPRPLESVMEARGFSCVVETKGPEHVIVTFRKTPEAERGDLPLVDRHAMPMDNAIFQLAGVLRRLKIGETFAAWLGEKPSPQHLNVLRTAGAEVDIDSSWDRQGTRLVIRRVHP
ncbi:DUF2249 domain-containing protein [Sulfobacillus harzensis]|uniref:DUF2249 domain-containing protein n=1 Tax=Sulfobacillus harzensis TaxID=2729629 RepID=A0A7Y0Q4X7_9FIRM|nr:DUF2249 domain-containing protein [Sulfobacillus harzensis]NMP23674.1 DUF2249 domain-containing protein [Sulfobacillus harzensis]